MANAEAGRRGRAGATAAVQEGHRQQSLSVLMIGALGVVYGDIGTSPIYAFREALHASAGGGTVSRLDVLGVLSLIVWALTMIVTVKYVVFVLRADNRGEGGTLSLMALARGSLSARGRRHPDGRYLRRRAVLRRCDHHAGDLGAVGGRGPGGGHPRIRPLCGADHPDHPRRAVCGAALRHRQRGHGVRAGDARLVHRHRAGRGLPHRR